MWRWQVCTRPHPTAVLKLTLRQMKGLSKRGNQRDDKAEMHTHTHNHSDASYIWAPSEWSLCFPGFPGRRRRAHWSWSRRRCRRWSPHGRWQSASRMTGWWRMQHSSSYLWEEKKMDIIRALHQRIRQGPAGASISCRRGAEWIHCSNGLISNGFVHSLKKAIHLFKIKPLYLMSIA